MGLQNHKIFYLKKSQDLAQVLNKSCDIDITKLVQCGSPPIYALKKLIVSFLLIHSALPGGLPLVTTNNLSTVVEQSIEM